MAIQTKDYTSNVSLEFVNKLLDYVGENNCEIECYGGSLLNNYIIYDAENIFLKQTKNHRKIKPRKYIILCEKYLNSWSSTTEIIMTDDVDIVEKYKKIFEE